MSNRNMKFFFAVLALIPYFLHTDAQTQIQCYHCSNVTHTYSCTKTTTCYGPYESCYIHANYESNVVSYTQGCMSTHLCDSGQSVSIIGRSTNVSRRQGEFAEFECCSGNLCNTHDSEVSGMVFKVSTHIGGDDVLKAWTNGTNTVSNEYCRHVGTYGCSKHYRHPVVDNWLGIKKNLIKYALYVNEQEVASIWFNGTGSTITDWFSHSRVINSTWTDLKTSPTIIFSLDGSSRNRRFSVEKLYGGCPKDYGWTVIISARATGVCGYDDFNIATPYIMYAKGNTSQHYPEGFAFADAAAVYIYGSDM